MSPPSRATTRQNIIPPYLECVCSSLLKICDEQPIQSLEIRHTACPTDSVHVLFPGEHSPLSNQTKAEKIDQLSYYLSSTFRLVSLRHRCLVALGDLHVPLSCLPVNGFVLLLVELVSLLVEHHQSLSHGLCEHRTKPTRFLPAHSSQLARSMPLSLLSHRLLPPVSTPVLRRCDIPLSLSQYLRLHSTAVHVALLLRK